MIKLSQRNHRCVKLGENSAVRRSSGDFARRRGKQQRASNMNITHQMMHWNVIAPAVSSSGTTSIDLLS